MAYLSPIWRGSSGSQRIRREIGEHYNVFFSLKTSNIANQHIKPGTSCFLLPMILMQVVRVLERGGIMLSYFLNATPSKNVVFDITNNKKTNITLYNKSGYPF